MCAWQLAILPRLLPQEAITPDLWEEGRERLYFESFHSQMFQVSGEELVGPGR